MFFMQEERLCAHLCVKTDPLFFLHFFLVYSPQCVTTFRSVLNQTCHLCGAAKQKKIQKRQTKCVTVMSPFDCLGKAFGGVSDFCSKNVDLVNDHPSYFSEGTKCCLRSRRDNAVVLFVVNEAR